MLICFRVFKLSKLAKIKIRKLNSYLFSAKTASAINPLVYAASHPKYREALAKEFPSLGIGKFFLSDLG